MISTYGKSVVALPSTLPISANDAIMSVIGPRSGADDNVVFSGSSKYADLLAITVKFAKNPDSFHKAINPNTRALVIEGENAEAELIDAVAAIAKLCRLPLIIISAVSGQAVLRETEDRVIFFEDNLIRVLVQSKTVWDLKARLRCEDVLHKTNAADKFSDVHCSCSTPSVSAGSGDL
jgi:hypothetical protein